ncbi:MAG TPA: HNH endonuclease family protein [Micromonosporaceae bacterium]
MSRSIAVRRLTAVGVAALVLVGGTSCVPPSEAEPGASVGPTRGGSPQQARALLDQLTVASSASMRGYSRERFPHWRKTGDNCNVRDTVLARDGSDIKFEGCNVIGGRWLSRYDDRVLTDPLDVDIDHMVPLANAWRSGANDWDDRRRGEFANDLDRPQLFAVSKSSNRAKGDQDPSQWKPPSRDDWCQYAQDWIAVKHYWQLSITTAEKSALDDMLETCR